MQREDEASSVFVGCFHSVDPRPRNWYLHTNISPPPPFLSLSLFSLSSFSLSLSLSLSRSKHLTDCNLLDWDVVIVGCGPAGIAAATTLQAHGLKVLILEGRPDRMGGRVWTNLELGYPVELGASWLHGINDNIVYPIAEREGIKTVHLCLYQCSFVLLFFFFSLFFD